MIFNTDYSPVDREYFSPNSTFIPPRPPVITGSPNLPKDELGIDQRSEIEPEVPISAIGMTVTEGQRFGTFIQTTQQAIRKGAGRLELQTQMGGGGEAVGAEAYGQEARREIREIAEANQVELTSVHTPTQVGNMAGYNPQEKGFSDEYRKIQTEEVKKAIEFAGDVTKGGAVVVHTGEYLRDMTDQPWNPIINKKEGTRMFQAYHEEPERATLYLVDNRTGKLITDVKKTQVIREPKFRMVENPEHGGRSEYIDKDGKFLDETDPNQLMNRVPIWEKGETRFETTRLTWDDFTRRADEWNMWRPRHDGRSWTPEELYLRSQFETQVLQARGGSLYHGRFYDGLIDSREEMVKTLKYYEKLEQSVPKEEAWRIMLDNPVGGRYGHHIAREMGKKKKELPSTLIKEGIDEVDKELRYIREASASSDARADEVIETMSHVVPVDAYAKEQTSKSYAEMGIHAMMQTRENQHTNRDIYVAPENLFPEMGYGTHPEELIQLVQNARQEMVKYLTEPQIEDPKGGWDKNHHDRRQIVNNPNYDPSVSKEEATELAKRHIKATLDTQHLGMWWKHFQPQIGESETHRRERFNGWYMEEIKKMDEAGIIGNIHIVDAVGGGHQHLPAGQGTLPVVEAVKYLRKKGYKGPMSSEAFGEDQMGPDRILTQTWRAFGAPFYRDSWGGVGATGGQNWTDVHHSYFGQSQSPYFIYGAYSPSNDWTLWSQVPME